MPGDPLKNVASGTPWAKVLNFNTMNRVFAGTRAVEEIQRTGRGPTLHIPQGAGIVLVKNNSGSDQERNYILGIDGIEISPTDNADEFKANPVFTCSTPATATHTHQAVVLAEPIANGAYGRAHAAGLAICQINVTDAAHIYAQLTDGDATKLTSDATQGFPILWKDSGTGTLWAVIRLAFRGMTLAWTELTDAVTISTGSTSQTIEYDADDNLVGEKRFLLKFPSPMLYTNVLGLKFGGVILGRLDWTADDTPASGGPDPTQRLYFIEEDFNTGTVNWENQPSVDGFPVTSSYNVVTISGTDDANGGHIQSIFYSVPHIVFDPAGLGVILSPPSTAYGIEIRIALGLGGGYARHALGGAGTVYACFRP